jgi:MSHA biogenesis protein MshN
MSVINKMLRDLDHRQQQGDATSATVPGALAEVGVASVPIQPARQRRVARGQPWLLMALLICVAGAGWWWSAADESRAPVAVQVPVAKSLPSVPVPPPAPAASDAIAVASVLPIVEMDKLRMDPVLGSRPELAADRVSSPGTTAAHAVPSVQPAATLPMAVAVPKVVASSPVSSRSASTAAPPAPPALPTVVADAAVLAQRQQQAGRETLAQAQSLWNSGAHDNAIGLLQEALPAAERAAQSNSGAAGVQTLVLMLRELARMELAEGRAAAAWELLVRQEPWLANQPELWALRASAAQRLGRHQDSVQAYTMALQSRPAEQRWLLGAAVSLAAIGQTTAAGEMAEKARTVGNVSKEVLAYLRQQGVPLVER